MRQELQPARVSHPGRLLKRELEARGWSQKDLAVVLARPEQAISEIVNGSKSITAETAIELANAFGTSAEFWSRLQANHDLWRAKQKQSPQQEKAITLRARLRSAAPIAELCKRGWIKKVKSVEAQEVELLNFLGVESLADPPRVAANLRHSATKTPQDAAVLAWLCRVDQVATRAPRTKFQARVTQERLPELLAFAKSEKDAQRALDWVRGQGVAVALVQHLPRSFVDGAAYRREDQTPVLALSLRFDRIDYFWFTLLHELGHLLLGHKSHVDVEKRAVTADEEQANRFAEELLLPRKALQALKTADPKLSHSSLLALARELERHPGIILGQLQHRQELPFTRFRAMLAPIKSALSESLR